MEGDSENFPKYILMTFKCGLFTKKDTVEDLQETFNYIKTYKGKDGYILLDIDRTVIFGYKNVPNSLLGNILKKDFK